MTENEISALIVKLRNAGKTELEIEIIIAHIEASQRKERAKKNDQEEEEEQ